MKKSTETNIHITVLLEGKKYELNTYLGEYRNLMMLIYDKLITEDFGECKGVGRCGTCHIQVLNAPAGLNTTEGKEEITLSRVPGRQENSFLACQIMLVPSLNNLVVQVVENTN
jgi:ferredoxin, 2Fe-2S